MDAINIRQRIPFKLLSSDSTEEPEEKIIQDDQEQEETIHKLRVQYAAASRQQSFLFGILLILLCILEFIYITSPLKTNPFLAIIPGHNPVADAPIPLTDLFACLSIAIYLNLALLLYPEKIQHWLQSVHLRPLSYRVTYALSAIAPILCILLERSWQIVAWWSLTGVIVFIVQTVQQSMADWNQRILALEKLRYAAPGA